jgi:hypothetical protein
MTRLVRLLVLFALLAPLFAAAGCKQGEGDRCQVQSDCQDGLLCVLPAGATPQAGGFCQKAGSITQDLSVAPGDLAGADMSARAADLTVVGD